MSIEKDEHIQDCLQNKYAEFIEAYDIDLLFEHLAFLKEQKEIPDIRNWVISQIIAIDPTGEQDDYYQEAYMYED